METYKIDLSEGEECILGQGNFSLKTVDDIVRVLMASASKIKVGVAMNDGGMRITRVSGNDPDLEREAANIAYSVGAGHFFVVIFRDAYPVNILNDLMDVHGVCSIYAASANPMEVLVHETDLGRAIIGVVDGHKTEAIETAADREKRKETLKRIGYHLG
ncbi:MAG: adenosine monophosphate-protein transferase [Candidatus Diapherotrites archaeon]|nr:adenosine monophosphate-protein transferase [Candidatus Diapherotrites archaeon]